MGKPSQFQQKKKNAVVLQKHGFVDNLIIAEENDSKHCFVIEVHVYVCVWGVLSCNLTY